MLKNIRNTEEVRRTSNYDNVNLHFYLSHRLDLLINLTGSLTRDELFGYWRKITTCSVSHACEVGDV